MEDGEYERFLESLSKPDEDDFSNELSIYSIANNRPIQPPFQSPLKECFSLDPRENWDGEEANECEPLIASDPISKTISAASNFLDPEPDLTLPAYVSVSERLSFAAQNFLDSDEPDETLMASFSTSMKLPSLAACIPCDKGGKNCDKHAPCSNCIYLNMSGKKVDCIYPKNRGVPDLSTSKEADVTGLDKAVASKAVATKTKMDPREKSEGLHGKQLKK
ncbi:hypothetical protein BCIN_03g00600 [Botrytis cinerea B05.10]|uniref:Uncharacterized protein n=3 Tax=Botryotinia fuckeliana TaxID=40559 RepID=A0A384JBA4_BOTFB|nr:hypothetical protein BCIN_03g00600 [Botrytis cinerea B05.10]ATZ47752.1 hypothetical protein BCIN_03g00600 [Botrytis cinerea B05.10]EMR83276.1 putative transcription factor cys6 protein [Botrytis cinerea BcDW1]CCD43501.1 similar to transcription factor Cys6 [Botrytis cinerea T4]